MRCVVVFLMAAAFSTNAAGLTLPDLLTTRSGEQVRMISEWKNDRRLEILELFRENVYGRAPVERPGQLAFTMADIVTNAMDGAATLKRVEISFHGPGGVGTIHLVLFVPNGGIKPAPCFLLICNRGRENIDPSRKIRSAYWPAERIVTRGYAAAAFCNADVVPDETNVLDEGVFRIFNPVGSRRPDAWGAIAAWAWGASRVMDYLQTDRDIDPNRVAVVGHSRGGKAALWAGAEDERFAIVISNESGSTGAALARNKRGERIRDINERFPYWFCENYKRYNDREDELPVDQHMLAALIAPRLLYIASAGGDSWSDPENEFLTAVNAGPVYQLFGLDGLASVNMPKPGSPLLNGQIGYHIRTGSHDLTEYDWNQFMNFADLHYSKILKNRH